MRFFSRILNYCEVNIKIQQLKQIKKRFEEVRKVIENGEC